MESVIFDSVACLMNYFKQFGAQVGPRNEPNKGTQEQKEVHVLWEYLRPLAENNLLEFPLTIKKSESPDFLLMNGETLWGLEITEATTKKWQRELTITENDKAPQSLLGPENWLGNSAEREICAAILRAIRRKAKKIKNGGYYPVSRYDLLIYVNVRAIFYDNDRVADLLKKRVSRWSPQWVGLGRVNVVMSRYLLFDVTNDQKKLQLFR